MDMIDAFIVHASPLVQAWPITRAITRVDMDARGGIALTFDAPLPETWKWFPPGAPPGDNFQFTVWCFARLADGFWHGAGFVQMWQGRSMTDGSIPAPLSGYRNLWGDSRRLWGELSDYVPHAGDTIGLMVSAGNARLQTGATSVAERSNIVTVTLPANECGSWAFTAAAPPPATTPSPPVQPPRPPPPIGLSNLEARLAAVERQLADVHDVVAALAARKPPSYRGVVTQRYLGVGTVELKPGDAAQ